MVAVVGGVTKVVVEVEDQERAKRFWTETMGFELVQDSPYGEERWLEVRTPDKAVICGFTLSIPETAVGITAMMHRNAAPT